MTEEEYHQMIEKAGENVDKLAKVIEEMPDEVRTMDWMEDPSRSVAGNGFTKILKLFGKAPAMVAVAVFEVILAFVLLKQGIDTSNLPAILWAINIPLYGGGAAKAWSDSKNGSSVSPSK